MIYDIIIVGAGLAGGALAASIYGSDLKIALLDTNKLIEESQEQGDPRTIAIASKSAKILDKFNIWEGIKDKSGIIEQIRIADDDSSFFLHFHNELVGNEPLGYITYNHDILKKFHSKILSNNNITFFNNHIVSIKETKENISVILNNGEQITAELLIIADGRMSKTRDMLDFNVKTKDYNHTAMISFIHHQKPHKNIAIEKFYSGSGPFASLPLKDQNISNIIWTEKTDVANAVLNLDEQRQFEFLLQKFGDFWGEIKLNTKIIGYPLKLVTVDNYYKNRVLLFGDAAHGIHPIAGQGYNMTIRDLEILPDLLINQKNNGLDLGSSVMLSNYQKNRFFDNKQMIVVTDLLNSLFVSNNPVVKNARKIGLSAINKIPFLKKFFMEFAMGERK